MKTSQTTVNYLRLLGATEKGRSYLNNKKKDLSLPLVSKLSGFTDPDIELDIKASKIYALGQNGKEQEQLLSEEFGHPPIMLKS